MPIRPSDHGVIASAAGGEPFIQATGGDSTGTYSSGGYDWKAHIFTSSGDFIVSDPGTSATGVNIFLMAGGGSCGKGGGSNGGGGAGGGVYPTAEAVTAQTYAIVV